MGVPEIEMVQNWPSIPTTGSRGIEFDFWPFQLPRSDLRRLVLTCASVTIRRYFQLVVAVTKGCQDGTRSEKLISDCSKPNQTYSPNTDIFIDILAA